VVEREVFRTDLPWEHPFWEHLIPFWFQELEIWESWGNYSASLGFSDVAIADNGEWG